MVDPVNAPIVAMDPVLGNVPETWHTITPAAGWSAVGGQFSPRYRMLADGSVFIQYSFTHAAFTTAIALTSAALPAPYRPITRQFMSGCLASDAALDMSTGGIITAQPPLGASTTGARVSGIYRVD
jgi:hypothetical protein